MAKNADEQSWLTTLGYIFLYVLFITLVELLPLWPATANAWVALF